MAAPPLEQQKAEDGDVVVEGNHRFASRAAGSWVNDGYGGWYSVNTDVQKAADAGTENKSQDKNREYWGHVGPVFL
jgi:hypothetical protein